MTPEQQRIAIAEACGWKRGFTERSGYYVVDPHGFQRGWSKLECVANESLPDYLNDLNAMHEAEKSRGWHNTHLNPEQYKEYDLYITHIRRLRGVDSREYCATASQRAEAFLRTLNLWKS